MKSRDQEYSVSKRLWSKQEDQLLIKLVGDQPAPKWTFIAQEFNQLIKVSQAFSQVSRTNKQCRQRWQNHLNPSLKNHLPWSEDQHRALFKLFKEFSHQWCELASKLESQGFQRRGENNIKNYFYSAIKREIKRMNEIIREKNKETKKKKSEINQYRKKYGYNPRLSLERQILGLTTHSKQSHSSYNLENPDQNINKTVTNMEAFPPMLQSNKQLSLEQGISVMNQQNNLHIIKQLDHQLISKILLIAQEKGSKKFVISSHQSRDCHQEAEKLRNQLIEILIKRQEPMEKEAIIELVIRMLKMSRKCKRKAQKMGNDVEQNFEVEDNQANQKKIKSSQDTIPSMATSKEQNCNENTFNQKAQLDKLFKIEEKPTKGFFSGDFMKSSQEYKHQEGNNHMHLSILSSFDPGRHLLDSRNLMQRSSDFLCNSGFSMMNFFDAHNPFINNSFLNSGDMNEIKSSKSPQNQQFSDFINNIREVQPKQQPVQKPLDFPQPHSVLFPVYDFSFMHAQKKSIFSSQPMINSVPSPQLSAFKSIKPMSNEQNQNNLLHKSWTFSNDMMEHCNRMNSSESKREEWVFTLPNANQNFQSFNQQ